VSIDLKGKSVPLILKGNGAVPATVSG